jgi:hypothetical protein
MFLKMRRGIDQRMRGIEIFGSANGAASYQTWGNAWQRPMLAWRCTFGAARRSTSSHSTPKARHASWRAVCRWASPITCATSTRTSASSLQQPTPAQYAELEKAGKLAACGPAETIRIADAAAMVHVNLPRQAVSLLLEWK